MNDCIFCKIIKGEISSKIIFEDEKVIAFNDINPIAPVHVLIVTKQHIENVQNISSSSQDVLINIHNAANVIAKEKGIFDKGYRLITNCGKDAGQTVFHMHYHLIGGAKLGEKLI